MSPPSHPDTNDPLFVPRLATEPEPCAGCGALLAPDQRYCLSCGERRAATRVPFQAAAQPAAPAAAAAPAPARVPLRRRGALPGSAISALYGLAGAAALGIGLLAGALIVRANDDPAPQAAILAAAPTASPAATSGTPAPTPTAAPAAFTPDWPSGQTGWTVQLQTLPKEGTTPEAIAAAKADATASGAPEVGALDSDLFPTLDGGNYVIYSGIADSEQAADQALDALLPNFPAATVVEVSDTAATDSAPAPEEEPVKKSKEDLETKEKTQSPEDAQKNTRKAPPTVESEGTPPPPDDEEPGAGSEATEIG